MGPNGFMYTATELGGNALFYSIIQKIRSNPTFGKRFFSFVGSDATYQLLLRHWVDHFIPFMRPASIQNSLGIRVADIQDSLKAIPVTILQQIACKVFYGSPLTAHLGKNLIDSFAAYTASNVAMRNLSAGVASGSKELKAANAKYVYRY